MSERREEGESNREFDQQPDKGSGKGLPPYDFYQRGMADSQSDWLLTLCQFLKNRSNSTVVVIMAIMALAYVAVVFVKHGNTSYVKLIGGIIIGVMIFALGLLALFHNIRFQSGKNTEKKQRGSLEPGSGQGSQEKNGDIERPDQRGESD